LRSIAYFGAAGILGRKLLGSYCRAGTPFDPNEGCGEIFFGADPFTGRQLTGDATCSSGNPALKPETSLMSNFGVTWEPDGDLNRLSISLDYQQIEYTDRIRTLSTNDTVNKQFTDMLIATGASSASYIASSGSATRNAADAWLRTQDQTGSSGVIRDGNDQSDTA
jgi:iron complex outermembrane receptor protein